MSPDAEVYAEIKIRVLQAFCYQLRENNNLYKNFQNFLMSTVKMFILCRVDYGALPSFPIFHKIFILRLLRLTLFSEYIRWEQRNLKLTTLSTNLLVPFFSNINPA